VAGVIDLVVHVELLSDGRRRVQEVIRPMGVSPEGTITAETVFSWQDGVLRSFLPNSSDV
jgi:hypothetical protein